MINDNFIVQQTNGVMTLASTYTDDTDSATVKFI